VQTERVTILAPLTRKTAVPKRAAARGIFVGEYARRRFEDDDDEIMPEQESAFAALIAGANAAHLKCRHQWTT